MEKFYKGVGRTLTVLAVSLIVAFPATWFIMIALGILHHRWEQIPAFGYWEVYVLNAALNLVASSVKTGFKAAPTGAIDAQK